MFYLFVFFTQKYQIRYLKNQQKLKLFQALVFTYLGV